MLKTKVAPTTPHFGQRKGPRVEEIVETVAQVIEQSPTPEHTSSADFKKWLFDQVERVKGRFQHFELLVGCALEALKRANRVVIDDGTTTYRVNLVPVT